MPTGSIEPPWTRAARSSCDRTRNLSRSASVRTRLRVCQRQSFQSLSAASGKKVLRKLRVRGVVRARGAEAGRGGRWQGLEERDEETPERGSRVGPQPAVGRGERTARLRVVLGGRSSSRKLMDSSQSNSFISDSREAQMTTADAAGPRRAAHHWGRSGSPDGRDGTACWLGREKCGAREGFGV